MAVWYASIFAEIRYAGTVRFFCDGTGTVRLFCNGTGTVRYVGTWFELKIPDFLHIAPAFCM